MPIRYNNNVFLFMTGIPCYSQNHNQNPRLLDGGSLINVICFDTSFECRLRSIVSMNSLFRALFFSEYIYGVTEGRRFLSSLLQNPFCVLCPHSSADSIYV